MSTERMNAHFLAIATFCALAAVLLALTLAWHIPMMLWDHLDLIPIYQAWQAGSLSDSDFWRIHGGHMHTAAYAVLLATTALSRGQPWLDCLASWMLLLVYAYAVTRISRTTVACGDRRWLPLFVFLALYPGHLANLQWGWQVAVFLCLTGLAGVIASLTSASLDWRRNAIALTAAVLAYLSFATGIALIPTAIVLVLLRNDLPLRRRAALILPWLVLAVLVLTQYRNVSLIGAATGAGPGLMALYTLNFLGAGVARFATDLAPWLAVLALATGTLAFASVRRNRVALPWLGFVLFALFSAVLTAYGRAGHFGTDHAFVTRYVSFSSAFWLGWLGLIVLSLRTGAVGGHAIMKGVVAAAMAFALGNSVHMIKKAARESAETQSIAATLRSHYPAIDPQLLKEIYFDRADTARARLDALKALSFAPFENDTQIAPPTASTMAPIRRDDSGRSRIR